MTDTAQTTALAQAAPKSVFADLASFEAAQRMMKPLATSDLVPDQYKNNIGNCLIAYEMAQRNGSSVLSTMQSMYIVNGRPSWSASYLIACINASGKFSPLRYRQIGNPADDSKGIVAWAVDASGETLESPAVTLQMARKEGWFDKRGSKWQTMPDLMLRYRAATLFARLYCPEISLGMVTAEEAEDMGPAPASSRFRRSEVTIEEGDTREKAAPAPDFSEQDWSAALNEVGKWQLASKADQNFPTMPLVQVRQRVTELGGGPDPEWIKANWGRIAGGEK